MPGLAELPPILRLDLAEVELPDSHPALSLSPTVSVHGYCIVHPDGPILVDTGVGYGNELIDELYRPRRRRLGDLLDRNGVDPDRIVAVVNSHLHFDHCGQNPSLFGTGAPFLAQADEFRAVTDVAHYTDPAWALAPEPQRRIVRGDERIADGVTVLATPGHTAGHQSVLVEAGGRRVVIGAQLVWHGDEYRSEVADPANVDPDPALQAAAVDSIRRIKALRPEVVHFSHCPSIDLFDGGEHGS